MDISSSPPPLGGLARFVRAAARRSSRRPKTVIALWLALIVACTMAGAMAGTRTLSNSASGVGESAHAQATLQHAGLGDPARETILLRSATAHRTATAAAALAAQVRRLPHIGGVQTPASTPSLVTDGGRTALVVVTLRGSPDDADNHVLPLLSLVQRMGHSHPGVTVQETGDASGDHAITSLVSHGLQRAEIISVPITLLVLLLAFGALVAASVPLLLGVTSVAAAMGALGLVSQLVPEGSSTAPVVVLIGLAVGIDYSLFAIRRERAERRAGRGPEAALEATAATVGRAILVAGVTVIIGLVGLLFSGFAVFTSMAVGAIIVVAIAVLGSLTVLPAVLSLLGDRVDKGRVWRRRRPATSVDPRRSAWGRIAAGVTGHPRTALALALVALVALAVPVLSMHTAADDTSALPAHTPVVVATKAVQAAFPGASDTETLVVSGHALGRPAARAQLARLGDQGRSLTGGHGPVGVRVSGTGAVAAVDIPVPDTTRAQAQTNVHVLRAALEPAVVRDLRNAHAQLAGTDAENVDFTHQLSTATPLVIAFVLVLAFVLLVATFGSPWLAVSVMGLNLLSVGAAFGLMVAVFQHHWAQGLLGCTSTGAIINWLPLFAFVVLFGLSMDYTVLVLERAAEARRAGASAREAAAQALGATGSTVSSAALVMVSVFAIFATLPLLDFKQMGIGLAAAIALDATLVRGVALPAALTLLGDRGLRPAKRGRVQPSPSPAWDHHVDGARLETSRG
jgi:RND superfamily putative drug exporter